MRVSTVLLTLGFCVSFGSASAEELQKIERLEHVDKTPTIRLNHFIDRNVEEIGRVIGSYRQAMYLTDQDRVYLSTKKPVSVGDRFTVLRDEGRVSTSVLFGRTNAHRYSIRGYVRVTRVHPDAVEAVLYNVSDDIQKKDMLVPYMANTQAIKTQEPQSDIRGSILSSAEDTGIIGSYELTFLDKGQKAGLRLNDRLVVYRRATESGPATSSVEIPVATLVVVHLADDFATAYTLASSESFEPGSNFKADRTEVRYLD